MSLQSSLFVVDLYMRGIIFGSEVQAQMQHLLRLVSIVTMLFRQIKAITFFQNLDMLPFYVTFRTIYSSIY